MLKSVIVAKLAKIIGAIEVDGESYDLIAPNGWVVQEFEALGDDAKVSDAYRLVGRCAPSMPEAVLMLIAADDIINVLNGIRDTIKGMTREVVPEDPKADQGTSA